MCPDKAQALGIIFGDAGDGFLGCWGWIFGMLGMVFWDANIVLWQPRASTSALQTWHPLHPHLSLFMALEKN